LATNEVPLVSFKDVTKVCLEALLHVDSLFLTNLYLLEVNVASVVALFPCTRLAHEVAKLLGLEDAHDLPDAERSFGTTNEHKAVLARAEHGAETI